MFICLLFVCLFLCPLLPQHAAEWPHTSACLSVCLVHFPGRLPIFLDHQATDNVEPCCSCVSGLSYASHTVGFTPPTSLTRAGMSYYNSPGLHVQHMGASHGITVSVPVGSRQLPTHDKVLAGLWLELRITTVLHLPPGVLDPLLPLVRVLLRI